MESDNLFFIAIAVVAFLIAVVTAYIISSKRYKKYIIYADNKMVKTTAQIIYDWRELNSVHFINKYVAGKGTQEMNYGIKFYFSNGAAFIDRKSNIYEAVFSFSKSLQVPSTSVVTKGLIFEKKK